MKTEITELKAKDESGKIHTVTRHQPKNVTHTLDGPEYWDGLPHYEYRGIRINPPKDGVFDLSGIKATLLS